MSYSKQQILNLFQDNTSGDITPADMRIFIDAIFDGKENKIYKFSTIAEVPSAGILKNDIVIIISDPDKGIYISQRDNPIPSDLLLVSIPDYIQETINTLRSGQAGQVLYTDADGLRWSSVPQDLLVWEYQGQDTLERIIRKPCVKGNAWRVSTLWNDTTNTNAGNDEQGNDVQPGDFIIGSNATGICQWVNMGPIGGSSVQFATRSEAENGCTNGITNKVISPETLCQFTTNKGMLYSSEGDSNLTVNDSTYTPTDDNDLATKIWVETRTIDGGTFGTS